MMLAAMLALVLVAAAPVLAQVAFGIGDAENESGEIETENAFEIEGNNNNACLGQQQFGQTGNFTNQQGALQFGGGGVFVDDDNDDRDHNWNWWNRDRDHDWNGWDRDRDNGFFFGNGNNNNGDLE